MDSAGYPLCGETVGSDCVSSLPVSPLSGVPDAYDFHFQVHADFSLCEQCEQSSHMDPDFEQHLMRL